jgi:hypothetical protein
MRRFLNNRPLVPLIAVAASLLFARAASTHGSTTVDTDTHGMLTFYAATQVGAPADASAHAAGAVTVSSPTSAGHYVKISGPPNEGGIPVSYNLYLYVNETQLSSKVEVSGQQVGTDGDGIWISYANLSTSNSPGTGTHEARAEADIQHDSQPETCHPLSAHGHSFTVGL